MEINNPKYDQLTYTVSAYRNFTLTEALRLWKAKYPEFVDFKKDVIKHKSIEDFGNFVEELWDDIQEVTIQEAFAENNLERRRVYFDAIGIRKLFKELDPELLNREVINKKRIAWDDDNKQFEREFEDVYELYKIDAKKIAPTDPDSHNAGWMSRRLFNNTDIYAVRCWCTTTNREYWIYVPEAAFDRHPLSRREELGNINYDAIQAIAWTIRIDVTNPERIYRQGDIIVVKLAENSEKTWSRHLTKEQYLELMYSET
jgi:hypothetical protein